MSEKICLNCGRNSDVIPLLTMEYRGVSYFLCPQCLPVMIHKPQNLVGKLPGAENFVAVNPEH